MSSQTKTGFLNINLQLTVQGSMSANHSEQVKGRLLAFLKGEGLNATGELEYVRIDTEKIAKSYAGSNDTSS